MTKKVFILGGGESGVGAAILAQTKGFEVAVFDQALIREDRKKLLDSYAIAYFEKNASNDLLAADIIIKSPGIPLSHALVQEALAKDISVLDELDFAYQHAESSRFIVVTGTNGKTTTAHLIYHLMHSAGMSVALCGNMGVSLAGHIATQEQKDWYVVEASSFQIEMWKFFKADIGMILNLTPDHLDRYQGDMEAYLMAKWRMAELMDKKSHLLLFDDGNGLTERINSGKTKAKKLAFGTKSKNSRAWEEEEILHVTAETGKGMVLSRNILYLKGKHNGLNLMAAALTCQLLGMDHNELHTGLKSFKNVPHRMELVTKFHGVSFINDSKATNVDATFYALEGLKRPIIWIAGGVDKGNDYQVLKKLVKSKVKGLICLGKDNSKLKAAFKGDVELFFETQSMEEAVMQSLRWAERKDAVLLSPACASFDLFKNFEDRGEQFSLSVMKMTKETEFNHV